MRNLSPETFFVRFIRYFDVNSAVIYYRPCILLFFHLIRSKKFIFATKAKNTKNY